KKFQQFVNKFGGPSENRTRTPVRVQVFETCASTNSAKGPKRENLFLAISREARNPSAQLRWDNAWLHCNKGALRHAGQHRRKSQIFSLKCPARITTRPPRYSAAVLKLRQPKKSRAWR